MLLKTKVAVTQVSNLHDARYCAGMGVDWVSFPITGERAVSPQDFEEITGWITGPKLLAEADDAEAELAAYQFDGLLTSHVELVQRFTGQVPILFKLNIDEKSPSEIAEALEELNGKAEVIILQSSYPFDEQDQDGLREYCQKYPILLSLPFNPENAEEALKLQPLGLSLKGSQEIKVGFNDFDGLADVIEALEQED